MYRKAFDDLSQSSEVLRIPGGLADADEISRLVECMPQLQALKQIVFMPGATRGIDEKGVKSIIKAMEKCLTSCSTVTEVDFGDTLLSESLLKKICTVLKDRPGSAVTLDACTGAFSVKFCRTIGVEAKYKVHLRAGSLRQTIEGLLEAQSPIDGKVENFFVEGTSFELGDLFAMAEVCNKFCKREGFGVCVPDACLDRYAIQSLLVRKGPPLKRVVAFALDSGARQKLTEANVTYGLAWSDVI